jgi:hypothetical protein
MLIKQGRRAEAEILVKEAKIFKSFELHPVGDEIQH